MKGSTNFLLYSRSAAASWWTVLYARSRSVADSASLLAKLVCKRSSSSATSRFVCASRVRRLSAEEHKHGRTQLGRDPNQLDRHALYACEQVVMRRRGARITCDEPAVL